MSARNTLSRLVAAGTRASEFTSNSLSCPSKEVADSVGCANSSRLPAAACGTRRPRQTFDVNHVAGRQHASVAQCVFELPYVAWPRMRQSALYFLRYATNVFVKLIGKPIQQEAREQRKVLPPVDRGGRSQFHHRQPIVEIFAELVEYESVMCACILTVPSSWLRLA
jgi:hypothetical protein